MMIPYLGGWISFWIPAMTGAHQWGEGIYQWGHLSRHVSNLDLRPISTAFIDGYLFRVWSGGWTGRSFGWCYMWICYCSAHLIWNQLSAAADRTDHGGGQFCLALCSECGDFSVGISRSCAAGCSYHEGSIAAVKRMLCHSGWDSSRFCWSPSVNAVRDFCRCHRTCFDMLLGNLVAQKVGNIWLPLRVLVEWSYKLFCQTMSNVSLLLGLSLIVAGSMLRYVLWPFLRPY